jgi:outer membrane lipoprotein-sorting protein
MEIENPKQIYVGDSVSLWIYLPNKKRAIRQHLGSQIPFALNPDIFLKDYNKRFNAELKINKYYEIIFTPKEETEIYKKIIIMVHPERYEINGITIIDETDSENKFIFKNIQLNKKISKKIFEFKPPKGTEIIEQ